MPREYRQIKILLPKIKEMIAEGKTHKEIEEYLGLTGDRPVHNLLKRERRAQDRRDAGIPSKQRGRKAAISLQEYKYENKRLRMENELLRDFLYLAGRK